MIDFIIVQAQCDCCASAFTSEVAVISGKTMPSPKLCDTCSQEEQARVEQKKKLDEAIGKWEKIVPDEYRATDKDHPDYKEQIHVHAAAMKWLAGEGILGEPHRIGLGIIGASGVCKTRIASQVVKRHIWNGGWCYWINSADLQWACQNRFRDSSQAEASTMIRRCASTELLVIDDIGSLKGSGAVADILYGILEWRTSSTRPFIWTSNETLDEMLVDLETKPRERIVSRIAGYSNMINI